MHQTHTVNPFTSIRRFHRWLVLTALALAGLLALVSVLGNHASSAGTLVVIEDVSQLGNGSFSGNVCYQVVRDRDGVTMSEGCFSIAATIAAPEGFDTSEQYTILISLADDNCALFDDPRTGNGTMPFTVRVSCDEAFMTATANAGGPMPTEPAESVAEPGEGSAPVELTAWPPVYDLPTVTILPPVSTVEPSASPIPMPISGSGSGTDQSELTGSDGDADAERNLVQAEGDAPAGADSARCADGTGLCEAAMTPTPE